MNMNLLSEFNRFYQVRYYDLQKVPTYFKEEILRNLKKKDYYTTHGTSLSILTNIMDSGSQCTKLRLYIVTYKKSYHGKMFFFFSKNASCII